MKKHLYYLLSAICLFSLTSIIFAQDRPINQPTPLEKQGNLFQSEYINYDTGRDSTDFWGYGTLPEWDSLKTAEEREAVLDKVMKEEWKLRQTQNYDGYKVIQAFLNINGESNVSALVENEKNSSGNLYDSTGNAYFNKRALDVQGVDSLNYVFPYIGFLRGYGDKEFNPLKFRDFVFYDVSDSNKKVDLSNMKYVTFASPGLNPGNYFDFNPDVVKFKLENGSVKDTIFFTPYLVEGCS